MTTSLPAAGYFNTSITNQEAKDAQDAMLAVIRELPGGESGSLTIASGRLPSPDKAFIRVDTEGAAPADDLDYIGMDTLPAGRLLIIASVDAARVVTVKHNAGGGEHIILADGEDLVLDDTTMHLILRRSATVWFEVGRHYGGNKAAFRVWLEADVARVVYTSDDTWSKQDGLRFADVEAVGAGGGGGGTALTSPSQGACAAGGGGGEYRRVRIDAATLGATETVTVPSGGAGGSAGNNPGSTPGSATSFGAHLTAEPGAGGSGMAAGSGNQGADGGAGGSGGSGGDLAIPGETGGPGRIIGGAHVPIGRGGSSRYGHGAPAPVNDAGVAATGYGAGGSGAVAGSDVPARSGGAGSPGLVTVHEHY